MANPFLQPCLATTMRNVLSTQNPNDRENPILGLIYLTGRPTILFNNASSNSAQCIASASLTRPMHQDERRTSACTSTRITTPPRPHFLQAYGPGDAELRPHAYVPTLVVKKFKNAFIDYVMQDDVTLHEVGIDALI